MGSSSIPHEHESNSDASFQIPFDLFVSKKQKQGFRSGSYIRFTDSFGNLVFKVERPANKETDESTTTSHHPIKLILDASGNTLISLHKVKNGSWRGFRLHDSREDLMFRVEETLNKLTRTEFDIFLIGENGEDSKTDFKMRGCPFKRSCTIYKGNSILAEESTFPMSSDVFISKRQQLILAVVLEEKTVLSGKVLQFVGMKILQQLTFPFSFTRSFFLYDTRKIGKTS